MKVTEHIPKINYRILKSYIVPLRVECCFQSVQTK